MKDDYGLCNRCKRPLSWGEYKNSKASPKCCYPCWLEAQQNAEIKYGRTGLVSDIRKEYELLLEERKS